MNPFSTRLLGQADWLKAILAITAISPAAIPVLYILGARPARAAQLPEEARTGITRGS